MKRLVMKLLNMKLPLVLQKLFRRRIVLVAALCLTLVVLVSLFANVVTAFDPNDTAVSQRLSQPSTQHKLGLKFNVDVQQIGEWKNQNSFEFEVKAPHLHKA